ncbi:ABC transporter ATP-binding protein [uncultured Cohaesibacter sp.]|uniref:ABC transporter ATP-binding protein n=1 Tax=uncultured Cohaesibacter sp. TaxID=1002546 RepID=UPI0029C89751|nr:ABC transporter ATP-binding protein [uncultured Cohaesibacter sp.]
MLKVENLTISFRTDEGLITPVQNISFEVRPGHTLGIVGESGSGKSISTKALMQLLPGNGIISPETKIIYSDKTGRMVDINKLGKKGRAIRHIRGGEIGMIFQEPMASFSPVYTIGNQMVETIRLHRNVGGKEARLIAVQMLERVGISNPQARIDQYPHEMSGGMRQRAMIALALSAGPALLIADEPTTALDVTIQAQVLELMKQLQRELAMGMIFITHDLGVISHVADDVAVMYLGTIVERGPTQKVIHEPAHPYTQGLIKALPSVDRLHDRLTPIPGDIPSPTDRPAGCPFHTRCARVISGLCDRHQPEILQVGEDHTVRCFLHEKQMRASA